MPQGRHPAESSKYDMMGSNWSFLFKRGSKVGRTPIFMKVSPAILPFYLLSPLLFIIFPELTLLKTISRRLCPETVHENTFVA